MPKGPNIRALQRGGAIAQLCLVYDRNRSKPDAWERVKQHAEREFRDASPATIREAIAKCRAAVEFAADCEACPKAGQADEKAARKRQGG